MGNSDNENDAPEIYLLGKTYLLHNEKFFIRNDPIVHLAAGDRHTIIVTESGRAFTFGDNKSGQLGLGHTDDTEKVSCIKSLKFRDKGEKVILAACGRESSLVATNQGSLYAFGSNSSCQLGIELDELTTAHPYPTKIEYFHSKISWKQISMGAEHTCALTNDGKVYVWGSNVDGQCGLARKYDIIRTPRGLRLEYLVFAISCGYYHTALIDEDGRLFLFGNNDDGQLGNSISDQYAGPSEVSLPDPVTAVACGNQHTVVLTKRGEVYVCGQGDRGQLGLGSKILIAEYFEIIENLPKHPTAIAAGEAHTAILGPRGDLYVFGDGKHGKLSYETHSNEFEPYSINKFKRYNVLKVVCGGCQTIILAQKKSTEDEDNTIDSKPKSIKSSVPTDRYLTASNRTPINRSLQYAEPFEKLNYSRKSPVHTESNSDCDELSASMKSALMNTRHVEIDGRFQPVRTSFINTRDFQPLKTGLLDHTVPLINMTDDLTKSNNRFSSTDKSRKHATRLIHTTPRKTQTSDDEKSSSEESSLPLSKHTNTSQYSFPSKSSIKNNHQQTSFDENRDDHSASSTPIRHSPSASSKDDNQAIPSGTVDDLHHSFRSSETKSDTINSTMTTGSQSGFFSRIFGRKSSQDLSITKNKNSKTCLIM